MKFIILNLAIPFLTIFIVVDLNKVEACEENSNPIIPSVASCVNGEVIIVSENIPGGLQKKCGNGPPQWRVLKTCYNGTAVLPTTEEFISFAKDNQNNQKFLEALKTSEVIKSADRDGLDDYLDKLKIEMKSTHEFTSITLNDDGKLSELKGLEEIRKMWTVWREKTSHSPSSVLNFESLNLRVENNNEKLKQFLGISCSTPLAKKIFEDIKLPVLRFSDNTEQVLMPFDVKRENKSINLNQVSGRLNNSGLFSINPTNSKIDVQKRSIKFENEKVYWSSSSNDYEIVSVREASLKESTESIYRDVDICKAQGLLKSAPVEDVSSHHRAADSTK